MLFIDVTRENISPAISSHGMHFSTSFSFSIIFRFSFFNFVPGRGNPRSINDAIKQTNCQRVIIFTS